MTLLCRLTRLTITRFLVIRVVTRVPWRMASVATVLPTGELKYGEIDTP